MWGYLLAGNCKKLWFHTLFILREIRKPQLQTHPYAARHVGVNYSFSWLRCENGTSKYEEHR